jgi:hypothetical protein
VTENDLQLLKASIDKIVKIICSDGETLLARVHAVSNARPEKMRSGRVCSSPLAESWSAAIGRARRPAFAAGAARAWSLRAGAAPVRSLRAPAAPQN